MPIKDKLLEIKTLTNEDADIDKIAEIVISLREEKDELEDADYKSITLMLEAIDFENWEGFNEILMDWIEEFE